MVYLDQEQIDNMHKQVAHYCGSSYLESYQVKQLQSRICKGVHRDCRLHYTEGVLRSECDGEFQRKYAKRDLKRNQDAYQANLRVYSRTIKRLRDALIRTLVAERARYPVASDSGDIDAAKVWRVVPGYSGVLRAMIRAATWLTSCWTAVHLKKGGRHWLPFRRTSLPGR